jgi:hypothetical protein
MLNEIGRLHTGNSSGGPSLAASSRSRKAPGPPPRPRPPRKDIKGVIGWAALQYLTGFMG